MEHFSLWLDGLNLAGQGVLHLLFASRLTGKRLRAWHFPAYLSLLGVLWLAGCPALGEGQDGAAGIFF